MSFCVLTIGVILQAKGVRVQLRIAQSYDEDINHRIAQSQTKDIKVQNRIAPSQAEDIKIRLSMALSQTKDTGVQHRTVTSG